MLTKKEVKVYRLCHHHFSGVTTSHAAMVMKTSERRIQQILADIKAKAPQLFPILTQTQARDYHLYTDEGWSVQEIADNTDRTRDAVYKSITSAIKKGMPDTINVHSLRSHRVVRYNDSMDNHIKEKF